MQATRVSAPNTRTLAQQERDQIVLDHIPLVKAIAIRVHENLPVHVDLDDLIHAGVMGLFDAVEKYDGAKNVAFHAYARTGSRAQFWTACANWTGRLAI